MNRFQLEERLVQFAADIIFITKEITKNQAGIHLSGQLIRSGTSVALNYAESLGAESTKDLIHKTRISLKELRETYVCLKIMNKAGLVRNKKMFDPLLDENNQLISIFVASIKKMQNPEKK